MQTTDIALIAAGSIGAVTAVIHGVLTQRFLVRPLELAAAGGARPLSEPLLRLIGPLMHFSTYAWLLAGLALIVAALWLPTGPRLTVIAAVGAAYLFGAAGNAWATRGRHPGWMLLAVSLALMAFAALA